MNKILEILDEYSKRKAGYIPLDDREELADEIDKLYRPNVNWAGLDSVKWGDVSREEVFKFWEGDGWERDTLCFFDNTIPTEEESVESISAQIRI